MDLNQLKDAVKREIQRWEKGTWSSLKSGNVKRLNNALNKIIKYNKNINSNNFCDFVHQSKIKITSKATLEFLFELINDKPEYSFDEWMKEYKKNEKHHKKSSKTSITQINVKDFDEFLNDSDSDFQIIVNDNNNNNNNNNGCDGNSTTLYEKQYQQELQAAIKLSLNIDNTTQYERELNAAIQLSLCQESQYTYYTNNNNNNNNNNY